jgi:hypothetical protein
VKYLKLPASKFIDLGTSPVLEKIGKFQLIMFRCTATARSIVAGDAAMTVLPVGGNYYIAKINAQQAPYKFTNKFSY